MFGRSFASMPYEIGYIVSIRGPALLSKGSLGTMRAPVEPSAGVRRKTRFCRTPLSGRGLEIPMKITYITASAWPSSSSAGLRPRCRPCYTWSERLERHAFRRTGSPRPDRGGAVRFARLEAPARKQAEFARRAVSAARNVRSPLGRLAMAGELQHASGE